MQGNERVLVLNQSFKPLDITDISRAIGLLYKGYASVVTENYEVYTFEDWISYSQRFPYDSYNYIRSVNSYMKIPKIIKFNFKIKGYKELEVNFSRNNIYIRDNYTCQYCGYKPSKNAKTELNIDHDTPKCKGGKTTWDNVVLSCISCNSKKGAKSLEEAGMELKVTPANPQWATKYSLFSSGKRYKEWNSFLDISYYNTPLDT